MTTAINLSDTQKQILKHAAKTNGGKLAWFPSTLRGGARKKVLDALVSRAFIVAEEGDWRITTEGYFASLDKPQHASAPDPNIVAASAPVISNAEAAQKPTTPVPPRTPRTRENSKQAQVIAMLRRPEGATIQQICETTGWQAHTVRGTFAGSFKKKLGLVIDSSKEAGGERVYHVAN